jgi:hypothetical protein
VTLWFCQVDGRTGVVKRINLDRSPAPTVCAGGLGDSLAGGYWIEDDALDSARVTRQPSRGRNGLQKKERRQ